MDTHPAALSLRPPPRRVLILALAPAQLLDLAGPAEVFAQASRVAAPTASLYDVQVAVLPEAGRPTTSSAVSLGTPPGAYRDRFRSTPAHIEETTP